jgi:hypothetical protein
MRGAGWLAGVAMVLVAAAAVRAEGPPRPSQAQTGDFDSDGDLDLLLRSAGDGTFVQVPFAEVPQLEPIKLSDYWIGVGCYPVGEALRAQLSLAEDEGLVVGQVVADSPAAKAGLQQHDVVVRADGKPLRKLQDLMDAVDQAKDKELKLDVIRGGKQKQVAVKPAKRPEMPGPPAPPPKLPSGPEWDHLRKWFEETRPWEEGKAPWRFRIWGPGTILPPGRKVAPPAYPPMPGGMSVTITKTGDEPAKIVVKHEDQKWEITEDELDKLPPDVRPHVERMLRGITPGRSDKIQSFDFNLVPDWKQWPVPDRKQPPRPDARPDGPLEKRLEEMNRRIDQLRKSIDELRQNRPRLKAPEPKKPEKRQEKV